QKIKSQRNLTSPIHRKACLPNETNHRGHLTLERTGSSRLLASWPSTAPRTLPCPTHQLAQTRLDRCPCRGSHSSRRRPSRPVRSFRHSLVSPVPAYAAVTASSELHAQW